MLRKLLEPRIWRRIYLERAGEPILCNLASLFVALFGNIARKIDRRLFKNALWLDQMFWLLDLSHAYYTRAYHAGRERPQLANPYLGMKETHVTD